MKPVMQTVRHNPPFTYGNCYRACVASILEINIDDIPPFETMGGFNDGDSDEWLQAYSGFLASRGYWPGRLRVAKGSVPLGYSILTGRSPRFPSSGHCVVAFDGLIVHDPAGLVEPIREFWDFEVLLPLEQERVATRPLRILDEYYSDWIAGPIPLPAEAENDLLFQAALNNLRAKKLEKDQ